jgi:hypothetical protein
MTRINILSANNQSEFLATPQLFRFNYADGRNGHEPTLLIKCRTLLIKWIVLGVAMQLRFRPPSDELLSGLKILGEGA